MAQQQQQHQHEFLPLCDVLFNIISLASYFCDVVFDLAMGYALAHHAAAPDCFFPLSITFVITSLVVSQIISIRWYLWGARGKLTAASTGTPDDHGIQKKGGLIVGCVLVLHSMQVGVLWRYFKLFIPVDLVYVKHEVRELCVLRLIHAFCEAAPMLLLQLYLLSTGITGENDAKEEEEEENGGKLAKLTAVSAGMSLWSVCWAVASFSKGAARLRNLERLVLTWLGVLAQLAWRLGTVSARVGALVAYASLYGGQWLLVVLALHWLSMLTWLLLTPDGLFHGGERLPLPRKAFLATLLAFVYVFAYVNLHETNHRQKMGIFYTVMFLENSLLVGVWATGFHRSSLHPNPITLAFTLFALFFGGLFFMALYYRFFHVRRLRYEAGGRMNSTNGMATFCKQEDNDGKQMNFLEEKTNGIEIGMRGVKLSNGGIPGVFNCRFANPTVSNLNRKKKKPTSFVPPPQPLSLLTNGMGEPCPRINSNAGPRQSIPFWRRPLTIAVTQTHNDQDWPAIDTYDIDAGVSLGGSVSANDIKEKLQEKKQQQLRELRAIQEEIKSGKLVPPPSASASTSASSPLATNQQPPPNAKLHSSTRPPSSKSPSDMNESMTLSSWPPIKMDCLSLPLPAASIYYPPNPWKASQRERAVTPEILLAPQCLPCYPHWTPPGHLSLRLGSNQNEEDKTCNENGEFSIESKCDSDVEGSQVSLPRSYTLPKEFKYSNGLGIVKARGQREYRGSNKPPPSRYYLPSTNSSDDGDVDSADNEEETDSELRIHSNNNHAHNNNHQLRFQSNRNNTVEPPTSVPAITLTSSCYLSSTYGALRPNQLLRAKVKHETKL
ncbi:uncharacterized protein LOC124299468 isoform X1 [Neodiprion virginianus]|uniref:uncharacterized protein LOC124299468 isoform X1 n=1 Tax=Neodiprion virginianus TaxID=2961670 RepID=UPI001EE6F0A0|nr:uncharacterized protein LOC124299468 isoform X1 [Neodiprion virginianus]